MQRYFVFVTPSQKLIAVDNGNGGDAMLHLLPNSCGTCSTWQTPTNCCHSSSSCFAFSFRPACSVLRWLIDLWIRGKFRAGKVAGNLCIFLVDFPLPSAHLRLLERRWQSSASDCWKKLRTWALFACQIDFICSAFRRWSAWQLFKWFRGK